MPSASSRTMPSATFFITADSQPSPLLTAAGAFSSSRCTSISTASTVSGPAASARNRSWSSRSPPRRTQARLRPVSRSPPSVTAPSAASSLARVAGVPRRSTTGAPTRSLRAWPTSRSNALLTSRMRRSAPTRSKGSRSASSRVRPPGVPSRTGPCTGWDGHATTWTRPSPSDVSTASSASSPSSSGQPSRQRSGCRAAAPSPSQSSHRSRRRAGRTEPRLCPTCSRSRAAIGSTGRSATHRILPCRSSTRTQAPSVSSSSAASRSSASGLMAAHPLSVTSASVPTTRQTRSVPGARSARPWSRTRRSSPVLRRRR